MKRFLVVDYSRTGNTRKVAQAIARVLGADSEEIEDLTPRHGLLGWLRSGRDAWRGKASKVAPSLHDPREYDLVILGSPVWAGRVSSPMRSYFEHHAGKFGRVALFVTEGGSGGGRAFAEMAELAGSAPVATLELTEKELAGDFEPKLAAFAAKVEAAI